MNLVIVESPTKARKLSTYLGKDFVVEASVGHIRDLPPKKLGVDLENNYEPTYEISVGKNKVVKRLKDLAKKADKIYLAMDPDREGEAIAWHVQHITGGDKDNSRFLRSTFNEITKSAVKKAIDNPGELNLNLVDAQQARRVLDRLVGYKVSPVLWRKVRRGLSAGRVQSVALRLITERELEIKAFKPDEYWEIQVGVSTEEGSSAKVFEEGKPLKELPEKTLVIDLTKVNGKKFSAENGDQAKVIVDDLKVAGYSVDKIDRKERKRNSLAPFTTSTLQQTASTRHGFSAKQTMMLAQQLYEEGLITYHRTDSVNLSKTAIDAARDYVTKEFGSDYLPATPRSFANKSKNAQEAHEAIRVTNISLKENDIIAKSTRFTDRHVKVYDLIWRRYVASQMSVAIYDQTTIFVMAKHGGNSYLLKTSGSVMKFKGWTILFNNSKDRLLPELTEQQLLNLLEVNPQQKFTQPPARFNDASLIKELEKRGIGRPSTYASIISVIVSRGYVERKEKKFWATSVGLAVVEFLTKNFPKMMNYDFTAEIEEDLDKISLGKKKWKKVVKDFFEPLNKRIEETIETSERVQIPVEKTGQICPDCIKANKAGDLDKKDIGEIVIRSGRFGKFKSCGRFPDCKFTENIVEKLEDVNCPLCQKGEVIVKNTRWGRSFFGCSLYPKCDWASWKKPEKDMVVTKEEWEVQQKARKERAAKRKKTMDAKKAKSEKAKPKKKAKAKKKTVKKKAKK